MEPKKLIIGIVTLFLLYLTVCVTLSLFYEGQLSHAMRGVSRNLRLMRNMHLFEGDYNYKDDHDDTFAEEGNSTMFTQEGNSTMFTQEANSTIL